MRRIQSTPSLVQRSLFFFSSQKVSSSFHHSRIVVTYHHAVKDDFIRGRRSCKEEAVGEGRVGADDASSRDARRPRRARSGYAFTITFSLSSDSFFCVFTKISFSLSFSLRRLSIKKLSAGKTRRKKSPSSPPRSFLASTEAF